jgi:hypothetical protein
LKPISQKVEQGYTRFGLNFPATAIDLKDQLYRSRTHRLLIIQGFNRLGDRPGLCQGSRHRRRSDASEKVPSRDFFVHFKVWSTGCRSGRGSALGMM